MEKLPDFMPQFTCLSNGNNNGISLLELLCGLNKCLGHCLIQEILAITFFFFFFFSGPQLRHLEVPRLGVNLEL